jgi:hypothetical protein
MLEMIGSFIKWVFVIIGIIAGAVFIFSLGSAPLAIFYNEELNGFVIPLWMILIPLIISVIFLILNLRSLKQMRTVGRESRKKLKSILEFELKEFSTFLNSLKGDAFEKHKNITYTKIFDALQNLRKQSDLNFEKKIDKTKNWVYFNSVVIFVIVTFLTINIYDNNKNQVEKSSISFYEAQLWDIYYYEDLDCRDPEGNDIFSGECETTSLEGGKIIREFDDYGVIYCSIHRSRVLYNYSDSPGMGLIESYSYPCWSLYPNEEYFSAPRGERTNLIDSKLLGYLSSSGDIVSERTNWSSKPKW